MTTAQTFERELKPWAQEERDDFEKSFGYSGNCSCHISPPCSSCVHPGNPHNQAEDENAWGFDLDHEVKAAIFRIQRHIEREVHRHRMEMKVSAAPVQESSEADELLVNLGLDPQAYRTDGGAINYLKVKAAMRHPAEYPVKREHILD